MTESHNMGQSSTRAEQADADARQLVAAAEGEAQQIGEKAAGSAAAAEREASWGKAIADGLQQGVESGLTSAGSSFGHAAGQKVSDKAFGDPEKKRLEREAYVERVADTVDRRAKKVLLTPAGRAFWEALQPKIYEFYGQAVSGLGFDDKVSFVHFLNRLNDGMCRISLDSPAPAGLADDGDDAAG